MTITHALPPWTTPPTGPITSDQINLLLLLTPVAAVLALVLGVLAWCHDRRAPRDDGPDTEKGTES